MVVVLNPSKKTNKRRSYNKLSTGKTQFLQLAWNFSHWPLAIQPSLLLSHVYVLYSRCISHISGAAGLQLQDIALLVQNLQGKCDEVKSHECFCITQLVKFSLNQCYPLRYNVALSKPWKKKQTLKGELNVLYKVITLLMQKGFFF